MKKTFLNLFLLAWMVLFFGSPLWAQQSEMIVRLKNANTLEDFTKFFTNEIQFEKTLIQDLNLYLFHLNNPKSAKEMVLGKVKQYSSVIEAFWNEPVEPRFTTPNDKDFSEQWALEKIGMPRVWDITTGGTTANGDKIVVAVLDSGFEPTHPDLVANLWQNPKEISDNGLDDDNNGYLDDTNGWNFGLNSSKFIPDSHGTPVAGIIGAVGNNKIGVSGINWQIQMILLQYKDVADIFEAYDYVIKLRKKYNDSQGTEGAFIVATNASFGLSSNVICPKNSTWDAIYNMLGEQGILTAASGKNSPIDTDTQGDTPSGCPSDYLISVITTDQSDNRWQGSAFGKISIDLGAPGEDILTILPTDRYTLFDANSAAAPHVAGAISILYSIPCKALADMAIQKPAEAAKLIRTAILDGVDAVSSLKDYTSTGGRLNVYNSMRSLETFCNPNPATVEKLKIENLFPNPIGNTLNVTYEVPDLKKFKVRIFDALGRLKHLEIVDSCCFGKKQWTLDISSWASGLYFLELELDDQKVVRTFNITY
jgi:subtilisin family serine protease